VGFGRRQVSWLPGLPLRAFPRPPWADRWLRAVRHAAMGIPGHSGGSAPDLHRLPYTNDRMNAPMLLHRRAQARPERPPASALSALHVDVDANLRQVRVEVAERSALLA
jgi:hypothetical protein